MKRAWDVEENLPRLLKKKKKKKKKVDMVCVRETPHGKIKQARDV